MTSRHIKSWNRFVTRHLAVTPEVMGGRHEFPFNDATITLQLPTVDRVGDSEEFDDVASIGSRWSNSNEPIEYLVHKVDFKANAGDFEPIPPEALNRSPNAVDLFSDSEQKHLEEIANNHKTLAESAFQYWLRVMRWSCDDYRIGRDNVEGIRSGWSTRLLDVETERAVWIKGIGFRVPGHARVNLDCWNDVQTKLSTNSEPPIYVELKQDAQDRMDLGDFRRAVVDMAIACETFMRAVVADCLPVDLKASLVKHIQGAKIDQYRQKFVEECLDETERQQFTELKPDLKTMFEKRNGIMHPQSTEYVDREACEEFLAVTEQLFAIQPTQSCV